METAKAKFFNAYLKKAIESLYSILDNQTIGESTINGEVIEFEDKDFEKQYNSFILELKSNCIEYEKLDIAFDYVRFSFEDILKWNGFEGDTIKRIISTGFEIRLLLDLKKNIEIYASKIKLMCSLDRNGDINIEFQNLFDSFAYDINFKRDIDFDEQFNEIDLSNLIEKFDFYAVKSASKAFEYTVDKIIFIQDRLYDYKQTKNMYKKDCIIEVMLSQSKDFEKLCTIELERLNKKLELELELKVGSIKVSEKTLAQIPKPETNTFNWNVSATDLLELIVALYKTESLKRTDGSSFTRKELIDYFQDLFGLEIKDVEIKLARATNRKMTMTPFLDKLKVAFENYAEVKEEKQQKRK